MAISFALAENLDKGFDGLDQWVSNARPLRGREKSAIMRSPNIEHKAGHPLEAWFVACFPRSGSTL